MVMLKLYTDMLCFFWCLSLHFYCCFLMRVCGAEKFTECTGLVCKNGGNVSFSDGMCSCACPENVSGLLCGYRLQDSGFPKGPFALPMSKDGCAEDLSQGWTSGFINITTVFPFDKLQSYDAVCGSVDEIISARQKILIEETSILGPFDNYNLQMNFCFKTGDHPFNSDVDWPSGTYGLYGTREGCPSGFNELFIEICLPPMLHYNTDGSLPGLSIEEHDSFAVINITYCRRNAVANDTEEHYSFLNSSYPFLLIKDPEMASDPCKSLDGYGVSEESFPIPLPAILFKGNTRFQLTYCRYVPVTYGTEQYFWDVFPGILSPFLDISLLVRRCGDSMIGTHIKACEEVEVWIMIDAGKTTQVSGVMWSDENDNNTNDFGRVSQILVGNKPWSFMHHGALLCEHHLPKIKEALPVSTQVYMCLRSVYGRYVTVVFQVDSWGDDNIFSDAVIYIMSYGTAEAYSGCSQEMGMTSLFIQDLQLTASTFQALNPPSAAWLHLSGWCAEQDDKYPYLQVDVGFVTIINGVTIAHWSTRTHTYVNNTFVETVEYLGTTAFVIKYGTDPGHLVQYQTREFIYDRSQPIGVPQTFLLQRPFLARFVRVYPKQRSPSERNCLKLEMLGCKLGLRKTTTNVQKLDKSWNAVFYGNVRKIDSVYAYLTNDGFPRYQDSNTFLVWNITIWNTFVSLQFVDIHLRIPKQSASNVMLNNKRCHDGIFISSDEITNPFVAHQESQTYIHLDSRYNNRQPFFLPSTHRGESIFLAFFVCSAHDIKSAGAAFRVDIADFSYPVCAERCTGSEMKLVTENFLGQFVDQTKEFVWRIATELEHVKGIIKIEDFDISCYSG